MSLRRAETFIADVERQYEWYAMEAGWDVAERYLTAVEATCKLLGAYAFLGSTLDADHPPAGVAFLRRVASIQHAHPLS
ncbi:MAG: type II toxin-antitoxin system RelE/ParE family toxin [Armatimonadetes bacterium]|nr:type II toxin-antitoxin system RelE/ParE family toxin [Armatimonadota bacterium]